jgi:integrase
VRLLKHSEIDLERCIATLGDTKTGVSVRPLSGAAIDIIKRQQATGEYVFALQGKLISNIHHYWSKLGLDKAITQHTLRHSFASLSADMGHSDNVIAGMLGHARRSITSRYIFPSLVGIICSTVRAFPGSNSPGIFPASFLILSISIRLRKYCAL